MEPLGRGRRTRACPSLPAPGRRSDVVATRIPHAAVLDAPLLQCGRFQPLPDFDDEKRTCRHRVRRWGGGGGTTEARRGCQRLRRRRLISSGPMRPGVGPLPAPIRPAF